jgi:hypothetical protein
MHHSDKSETLFKGTFTHNIAINKQIPDFSAIHVKKSPDEQQACFPFKA